MNITFQWSVSRHITTCCKLWSAGIYDFEFFQRIDPGRPLGSVFVHRIWCCEQRSSHHGYLHYDHDSEEIIRRAAGCTSCKRERQRSHNVYQRGVVRPSFDALECRRIGSVPLSVIGSWNCSLWSRQTCGSLRHNLLGQISSHEVDLPRPMQMMSYP